MKINVSQSNPNLGGVRNQSTGSQIQAPRQVKISEAIRDITYSPKSEKTPESMKDTSSKQKSESGIDEKQWIDVIEKANKTIEGTTCSFEFSIHEMTKQIMVKVIDKETKEVIREFPPEKILDMVAKMWEVAGIIVDERR